MNSHVAAWWTFCQERFAPIEHGVMVAIFTLANVSVAIATYGLLLDYRAVLVAFVVALSFFFRLRCFDEIKDYEVDIAHNPTRPLARGLLSVPQVKRMIAVLVLFEVVVVFFYAPQVLFTHLAAVLYSFLMFKEFFIGSYLRPLLTTYAVTHTFVSMLVGYSIAAICLGQNLSQFVPSLVTFGLSNWALFNLFEFARKTFAPEEERERVDSYSSLFRPAGAVALSMSQVLAGIFIASFCGVPLHTWGAMPPLGWHFLVSMLSVIPAVLFALNPTAASAKRFRNCTSLYLLCFYVLVICQTLL